MGDTGADTWAAKAASAVVVEAKAMTTSIVSFAEAAPRPPIRPREVMTPAEFQSMDAGRAAPLTLFYVGAEITKYIDSFFASGIINGWSAFDNAWKLHYFQYIARCRLLCANCHKRHDTDVANRRRTEERLARISGLGLWRM